MTSAGSAAGRRVHAYAYTLVTTAVVLLFALAEWGAERYLSDRSRAASTAVEVAIVLVAALVFRPIHQRVEASVEAAFYKRKRQALEALARFRRELTSFADETQLLRRVIEAVEHHLEARACAVYVKKTNFHARASSFDVPADDVPIDDPLAIRFASSGAPARPAQLKSIALGTHAFAMTAGGSLVGFLCVDRKDDYDAEETQMLSALSADLAVALVALDPSLRSTHAAPTNIPADLAPMLGRERELAEIVAALSQSRLITVTGAGGVGKTRIALACAAALLERYPQGAWFVNLAPIADGRLVAATILAALDGGGDRGDDAARLVDYLRARTALLVIDNCEHVIAEASALIAQIQAQCPTVSIVATSRELLHLRGEQVYRLDPLRIEAAVELFIRRASGVSPNFDPHANSGDVRSICEKLDGIPLAIELAAARVRALSAAEILEHLDQRFRLLTGGARTALPRQQTLAAALEWSYDLLAGEEQSLFRRLACFRGSFTLAAAAAVCAKDGQCDELHVLDVVTSLVDKSLVTAASAAATRYRMLETLRDFASHKAVEQQAAAIAQAQHAEYFASLASQAYREFDSRLPAGWLERLAPDIDNFRAALAWTLQGPGERRTGAQLAADCGPIFLRLELLTEGLRWCDAAREVHYMPAATAGRVEYVASMLFTNIDRRQSALECAERALSFYRDSDDERGLVRALSQVAQLLARSKRYDDAVAPAAEAIERARALGEPRVFIGVLRRCAFALPQSEIERARRYYAEALDLARSVPDHEEECRVLQWWATGEAACGFYDRAIDLASQGLRCADGDSRLALENHVACWELALNRIDRAAPHIREALELGLQVGHPLRAFAIAYSAPLHVERDPREAALIFGYASAQLAIVAPGGEPDHDLAMQNAASVLSSALPEGEMPELLARGATLAEDDVLRMLAPTLAGRGERDAALGDRVDALLR